jgi:hypothetical protein
MVTKVDAQKTQPKRRHPDIFGQSDAHRVIQAEVGCPGGNSRELVISPLRPECMDRLPIASEFSHE